MARAILKPRSWVPSARTVVLKPSAAALADVSPLLARVVAWLGTNAAARLLGADRAQVSRWMAGKEAIGSEMGRRAAHRRPGMQGAGAVVRAIEGIAEGAYA